jgi:tagaturonate reductase
VGLPLAWVAMTESILQFGAGNFLRAFADVFVAQANRVEVTAVGRVVVVESVGKGKAMALNAAGGRYHVVVQGVRQGRVIEEVEEVDAISRAFHAGTQWGEVLAVARSPEMRWVLSNTTEAGFDLDDRDGERTERRGVPVSFPAKLLEVLLTRWEAGLPAPVVVPCELVERNGARLRERVLEQAVRWRVEVGVLEWVREAVMWMDTLVDRIVPGPPGAHELLGRDPLVLTAEPFAFWGMQGGGVFLEHPAVQLTEDLAPYHLRKVRILNGAHTALVAHALPMGLRTVRECVEHAEVGSWLARVLEEEIVPVIAERVEDAAGFARATLERFANPFLEHRLESIALNHEAKVRTRLLPTVEEYRARFGREPRLLARALGL